MNRVIVGFVAFLMAVTGVVATSSAASAQGGPTASGGLSCTVVVNNALPTVEFATSATNGRIVIERRASSKYWWRTAIEVDGASPTTFTDASLPRGVAQVDYRVTLKASNGKVLERSVCRLLDTNVGSYNCTAIVTSDGFVVRYQRLNPSWDFDVVFRRQVADGKPFYWRGTANFLDSEGSWVDGPSSTGVATYQVFGRIDGVITRASTCVGGTQDEQCRPIASDDLLFDGQTDPVQLPSGYTANVERLRGPAYDSALVLRSPSGDFVECGPRDRYLFIVSVNSDRVIYAPRFGVLHSVAIDGGSPQTRAISEPLQYSWVSVRDGVLWAMTTTGLTRTDAATAEHETVWVLGDRISGQSGIVAAEDGGVYFTLHKDPAIDNWPSLNRYDIANGVVERIAKLGDFEGALGGIRVSADGTVTYSYCQMENCVRSTFPPGTRYPDE